MATQSETKGLIEKAPPTESLQILIQKSANELGKALPEHMNPERLVRIALTCIRMNPELARSTQESFLGALFTAAQIGIEPVAGRAALIPFWNSRKKPDGTWHKVLETQFLLMFKGIVELFYRHEKSVELSWGTIRQDDEVDWAEGTDAHLYIKPVLGNTKPIRAYFACAKLAGGGRPFKVMTVEECFEHGKEHSKTFDKKAGKFYDNSPWATAFDAMAQKTVLIQLAKLLPLSVELQRAIQVDESSRDFRKGMSDALDAPSTTTWNAPELPAGVADAQPDAQEPPAVAPGAVISEKTGKEIGFGE